MPLYEIRLTPDETREVTTYRWSCQDDGIAVERLSEVKGAGMIELRQGERLVRLVYRPQLDPSD